MAYINSSFEVQREVPEEDKQFLSALGFDVAAFIGYGVQGYVFSGVCNTNAKKFIPVSPNQIQSAPDSTYFDEITRGYIREVSLNGKSCAIKMFPCMAEWSTEWTTLLYNEAKTLTELDHQNIVEIYSVCKTKDNVYIIMEFLNGGSLQKFLNSLPLETKIDEYTALQIIRQLTAGLHYLHNQNKIHGDLHDENIMFTVQDNNFLCKIVDFGSSKPLEDRNNMNDITKLAYHSLRILDRSLFARTHIEGNLRAVLNMMSNRVFTNMDQVVSQMSRYLPESDAPPPPNSIFKRFANLFTKK